MNPSTDSSPASKARPVDPAQKIRHLSAEAQAAFRRFQSGGDPADLDPVIFAILESFVPRQPARPLVEQPGDARLVDDLRLDSIAIAEVVFFAEDLLEINISNAEIARVRTLDDLRGFIRQKVAARRAG